LSWTCPIKPTSAIAYEILKNNNGLILETSNKEKKRKKRKKSKRLVTIVTNIDTEKRKVTIKTLKVDQQTYKLIKRNKDYKPKTKKIWLPKVIRDDYRIKRFFS
jgi:fructose-1,6-bisphosphatase/inositol monophosphatase family enzyme